MIVYLVQHGQAKSKGVDPERRLSDEGLLETQAVGELLTRVGRVHPAQIFHSGKARAEQTAMIFARYLTADFNVAPAEGLAPMDDAEIWVGRLSEIKMDTMLVGHLPHLGKLASLLLVGHSAPEIVALRNSGVLALEKSDPGTWQILWYLLPEYVVIRP